jgi:hypothetical protein
VAPSGSSQPPICPRVPVDSYGGGDSLSALARCYNDMGHGEKIGSRLAGVGLPFMRAEDFASLVNPSQHEPDELNGSRGLGARPPCAVFSLGG